MVGMLTKCKKYYSILLAVALLVSSAASFQQKTMVALAEDAAVANATREILQHNTGAWAGDKSLKYSMAQAGSTVTFHVTPRTASTRLAIELNQSNDYVTAAIQSDSSIWTYPSEPGTDLTRNGNVSYLDEGTQYVIKVTRMVSASGTANRADYQIVVKNSNTGQDCMTFDARNSVLSGDASLYLIALGGEFEVYADTMPRQENHGVDRTRKVSLSEVNNTPPKDYVIPAGLVQDAKDKKYEKYFPKKSIQTVRVKIPDKNLDYMLQHGDQKPSVMTESVTIGDTTVGYAGMKTKGNYTLRKTYESSSDHYSFTLNFGAYIKKKEYGAKQNFYGCRKISFNNCFFDKTILKEYNAMRLMDEMGVPTPQYSLAKLYINDKYYGVYFMVEAMDGAIIERYKNVSSKEVSDYLVKPSYTNMTYVDPYGDLERCLNANKEFTMESLVQAGLLTQGADGTWSVGGVLSSSYGGMWEEDNDTLQDVAKTLPTVLTWNRRIQMLSDGMDFDGNKLDVNSDRYRTLLESVVDTDEACRYFAAHSFLVQMDNMFTWRQNYGLYVDGQGKSMLLPWDYDLAWGAANWGGFNTAEQLVNWDIDKMYPDNFKDRGYDFQNMSPKAIYRMAPLFYVIYQNRELMKKYHTYMEDCAKLVSLGGVTSFGTKVEPGRFAADIETYYGQVTEAAKTDGLASNVSYVGGIKQPQAAQTGIPTLKKLVARRAVGVWMQINRGEANVTGADCNILDIGTNFRDSAAPTLEGVVTVVDENTGVFANVVYPVGNQAAWIRAEKPNVTGREYQALSEGLSNPDIYEIKLANRETMEQDFNLYIPVSPEKAGVRIYGLSPETGEREELEAEKIGSIYCVPQTRVSFVAVEEDNSAVPEQPTQPPAQTPAPTEQPTQPPAQTPAPTEQPSSQDPQKVVEDGNDQDEEELAVGDSAVIGKMEYKVTKLNGSKREVALTGTSRKKTDKKFKTLTIGSTVVIEGSAFRITRIEANAFSGYQYLETLTIGKNVREIGSRAFYQCGKLKKITVKTGELSAKGTGKQAFKGIYARATIKVPVKKLKIYQKLLRARGVSTKARIKK